MEWYQWWDPRFHETRADGDQIDVRKRFMAGAPLSAEEVRPLFEAHRSLQREHDELRRKAESVTKSFASLLEHFATKEVPVVPSSE